MYSNETIVEKMNPKWKNSVKSLLANFQSGPSCYVLRIGHSNPLVYSTDGYWAWTVVGMGIKGIQLLVPLFFTTGMR